MAELSPPPPNSGLRILLTKDRPPSSSSSTPAAAAAASVSSHADRDRIIGVFRAALSMTESPEAFALQAVQEAIKPQKQTVLVQEENQSLENALRTLLQELVSSAVQSGKKIMQYGNSLDNAESNCLITRLLDIVLYLCERGHVEGGMVFQLLEDLTEMSTIKDCKDVFGYIESKQDVLGKQELFGRGKLVMLRTCNQLLRRLSKANDVVFCGRIIMFLAHFFPLSERSALNIKGVFNTSNETKYEKDATDGISLDFNFYKTLWSLQEHFSNPALTATNPTKWQKFASNLTGLYRDTQKNEMKLGRCSRTTDVVEPMIKPQWFVNCSTMAKAALDAVKSKRIEIIPPQYEQDWYRWLENICDWCISRQLWWGHRVPAWYVTLEDDEEKDMGSYIDHWIIARNESDAILEAKQRYRGKNYQLDQDPDVLDTWFSSGLFPLSVLGWPDDTADLSTFYPSSVLETGLDILFFWVARMVMMGMLLGGDVPFQKVYLHPIIRDAHGRKMSKSLGNVIDPIDVINGITLEGLHKKLEEGNLDPDELETAKEGQKKDFPNGIPECGTDALRFALISYTSQSDKINLDIKRVQGYRQWCNKLWNAIRFAMSKLGDQYTPPAAVAVCSMPPVCKWILSVLKKAVGKTVSSLEAYKFSEATSSIYSWWQYQLCDVFIEAIKPYFNESQEFESARGASRDALWVCLDTGLRLLHPFMPYVTEELWQRLPQPKEACRKDSIMVSEYPSVVQEWTNDQVENEMEIVLDAVNKLRSLRPPTDMHERRPAFVLCRGLEIAATVQSYQSQIATLASVSSLKILTEDDRTPPDCATNIVNKDLSVYLQLRGALNTEAEREKLRKKREDIQKLHDTLSQKMNASGYRQKAPQSKQDEDMKKLTALLEELEIMSEAESKLDAINGEPTIS